MKPERQRQAARDRCAWRRRGVPTARPRRTASECHDVARCRWTSCSPCLEMRFDVGDDVDPRVVRRVVAEEARRERRRGGSPAPWCRPRSRSRWPRRRARRPAARGAPWRARRCSSVSVLGSTPGSETGARRSRGSRSSRGSGRLRPGCWRRRAARRGRRSDRGLMCRNGMASTSSSALDADSVRPRMAHDALGLPPPEPAVTRLPDLEQPSLLDPRSEQRRAPRGARGPPPRPRGTTTATPAYANERRYGKREEQAARAARSSPWPR